jgi:hypothetical protein
MNPNIKKALLIFGGGLLLFWAFKKIRPIDVKSKKATTKTATDEQKKNAAIVLKAYGEAMKAGEKKEFLDEMNTEFAQEFGLRVYINKGDGKLFVADLEGNKI